MSTHFCIQKLFVIFKKYCNMSTNISMNNPQTSHGNAILGSSVRNDFTSLWCILVKLVRGAIRSIYFSGNGSYEKEQHIRALDKAIANLSDYWWLIGFFCSFHDWNSYQISSFLWKFDLPQNWKQFKIPIYNTFLPKIWHP